MNQTEKRLNFDRKLASNRYGAPTIIEASVNLVVVTQLSISWKSQVYLFRILSSKYKKCIPGNSSLCYLCYLAIKMTKSFKGAIESVSKSTQY